MRRIWIWALGTLYNVPSAQITPTTRVVGVIHAEIDNDSASSTKHWPWVLWAAMPVPFPAHMHVRTCSANSLDSVRGAERAPGSASRSGAWKSGGAAVPHARGDSS